MKTNKIFLMVMGLVVASLFASCKKDNNNENEGTTDGKGFIGYTEWGGGNTRTHGVPNGNTIAVNWTEEDAILVANQSGDTLTYTLSEGKDSTEGTFESERETEEFLEPNYAAIYPAKNAEGAKNNITVTSDGITATFNLPSTQNYLENSFAEKSMPMVAYAEDQVFKFKNALGGICFPIVGDGYTVTKIELISNKNEELWGTCTTVISTDGGAPVSTVTNTASGKNTITLDCGSVGIQLDAETPVDFYIMLPAGTLEDGFTVKAYNGTEVILEKSTEWTESITDFIPRNVVRKVNGSLAVAEDTQLDVTTISPTFITMNSAKVQGTVAVDAGVTLDACGVCYLPVTPQNYDAMPTLNGDATTVTASGTNESFSVNLTGLQKDQMYAVRAWVRDESGVVSYGDPILFATRKDYANDYGGRIPFPFSVGPNTKVNFSMGNLQYLGTGDNGTLTPQWRFADYQYDFLGDDPNILRFVTIDGYTTYNGGSENVVPTTEDMKAARDLFGWGTSGYDNTAIDPYAICFHPYSTSEGWAFESGDDGLQFNSDGYGPSNNMIDKSLVGTSAEYDWGVHNPISNGGNQPGMWRVMTGGSDSEWGYLLSGRTTETYRFAQICIKVKDVILPIYGVVLFPDGFEWPDYVVQPSTFYLNTFVSVHANLMELMQLNFSSMDPFMITEAEWSLLEQLGAVFLPPSGVKNGADIDLEFTCGGYWTSTVSDNNYAYGVFIDCAWHENDGIILSDKRKQYEGLCVRLVCPANQNSGNFNNQPFGVNP